VGSLHLVETSWGTKAIPKSIMRLLIQQSMVLHDQNSKGLTFHPHKYFCILKKAVPNITAIAISSAARWRSRLRELGWIWYRSLIFWFCGCCGYAISSELGEFVSLMTMVDWILFSLYFKLLNCSFNSYISLSN
jgi:hypothetical protein